MSDRNTRFLDLFLRETGRDAYFQRGLEFPTLILAAGGAGHALEAGDEDTVEECLPEVNNLESGKEGNRPTSSTHSCNTFSCSSMLNRLELTTSGLSTSNMIGFSGELVQCTQSLRGSSCCRIALIFSRHWTRISGFVCSILRVSLAVVASIAGRAAEYVYAAAVMR